MIIEAKGRTCSVRRIAVLRAGRRGDHHTVVDLEVDVQLRLGSAAGTTGEAQAVVRGVHALAAEHAEGEPEVYAHAIARYCQERIGEVELASVLVRTRPWERLAIGGRPRGRDFIAGTAERRVARAAVRGDVTRVAAGIRGILLLTGPDGESGPVQLRLGATWRYGWPDVPFSTQWQQVRRALLEAWAERSADSAAAVAAELGRAVLEEAPAVGSIVVRIAEVEREVVDMTAFGMENTGAVWGRAAARTVHEARLGRSELS
jgi:urate oxidase